MSQPSLHNLSPHPQTSPEVNFGPLEVGWGEGHTLTRQDSSTEGSSQHPPTQFPPIRIPAITLAPRRVRRETGAHPSWGTAELGDKKRAPCLVPAQTGISMGLLLGPDLPPIIFLTTPVSEQTTALLPELLPLAAGSGACRCCFCYCISIPANWHSSFIYF